MNYTMEFSETRNTWNVIDVNTWEWIYEGTYEECSKILDNALECEYEDYDIPSDYDEY